MATTKKTYKKGEQYLGSKKNDKRINGKTMIVSKDSNDDAIPMLIGNSLINVDRKYIKSLPEEDK